VFWLPATHVRPSERWSERTGQPERSLWLPAPGGPAIRFAHGLKVSVGLESGRFRPARNPQQLQQPAVIEQASEPPQKVLMRHAVKILADIELEKKGSAP